MMEAKDVVKIFDDIKRSYKFDFTLKDEQVNAITAVLNRRNVRSSKQHHEIELKWLLDYLCIMTTSSEKIIVYSRYAMTL